MEKNPAHPAASNDLPAAKRIGETLRSTGNLTDGDIAQILVAQRKEKLRFGEVAVRLNLVTEGQLQLALSQQYGYPYLEPENSNWSPVLFAAKDPFGAQSEAIRSVRSQLGIRGFGDKRKALVVTGTRTGDGASTLAANLAIAFAQMGERTLLMDADLRNPTQQQLFDLQPGPGLSALLNGRCSMSEALTTASPFENLFVLCAGARPPNPQELLAQVKFSYLIETAPAGFDVVIIDTPPLLEFADAQIVISRVGACLLAIRTNKSRLPDLQEAKALISPTAAELLGTVLNA